MKKVNLTYCFIFFLLSNFVYSSEIKQQKKFTIRADIWCPFNCDPKDKNPGYMIEIVSNILTSHGYVIDYQISSWSRSIHDARLGKVNAIIGAGKEDAPDFVFPTVAQGSTQYTIFGLPSTKWKYKDADSLKNVQLGVINNYTYDKGTNDLISSKNPSLFVVSSSEPLNQLIKLTENHRIIGFVESSYVLNYFIKSHHIKTKLKDLGPIKPNFQDLYLAVSPKHPKAKEIAELISKGTIALRKSGDLNKILKKYGIEDWEVKK